MEDWYQQQEFFTQAKMEKIVKWMDQEVIDLFSQETFFNSKLAI